MRSALFIGSLENRELFVNGNKKMFSLGKKQKLSVNMKKSGLYLLGTKTID